MHDFFSKIYGSLAVLLLLFISFATAALAESPSASNWRKAEALIAQGKGEESYLIFKELLIEHPDHNALLLGLARASALSSRWQESREIYTLLREKFPDNNIIIAESDQVFQITSNEIPLSTFSGRFRMGVMYDSNVNQGNPDDVIMHFGYLTLTVPGQNQMNSFGGYFGANLDYTRRLSQNSPWSFVSDFAVQFSGYENSSLDSLNSREWQLARIGTGVRYLKNNNLVDFRMKAVVFDYELSNHITSVGPEFVYLKALKPDLHLISQFSLDSRNFSRSKERNGIYGQMGEMARIFFSNNNNNLSFGGFYQWGNSRNRQNRYKGWTAPVRFSFKLTDDLEISPNFSFSTDYYQGPATVLENKNRRDERFRTGIDFIYHVTKDWGLEFNYGYNHTHSNSPFYNYSQHTGGLGVTWGF